MNVFCHMRGERVLVGKIAQRKRGLLFEYADAFIKTGLELSPFKLPCRKGVFEDKQAAFGGLHGLFNDSLPDGWGLLLLDRKLAGMGLKLSETTLLERLALVGCGGMGALEYEPETLVEKDVPVSFDLDGLAEQAREILDAGGSLESVNALLRLGGSSGGARPKILVDVRREDLAIKAADSGCAGFEPWMIKFCAKDDAGDLGLLEYAYSEAARLAGVEMPDTQMFPSATKSGFFGVKRFDRAGENKIHVHTACGLLHASHRHPSLTYESLIRLTQVLTKDATEVLKMVRLMVFNVKFGNRDDHSKNFSFLINEEGEWKMAPAYDLTPSTGFGGEHSCTVNGKGKNIVDADLIAVATSFGVSKAAIQEIIERTEGALSSFQEIKEGINAEQSKFFVVDCGIANFA